MIDLLARLRGGIDPQRRAGLLERFELDPRKKCRTYSKGNRQKVALVAALASDVELLLLDEPTSGLDPLMEALFRECITEEHARGRTVLLSSHILAEVEALCDRVSIIRSGRTVETGTLAELRHLTRTAIVAELASTPLGLPNLPGVHNLELHGTTVRFSVDPEALSAALRELTGAGVISLVSQPPTLEELFMRHYQAERPADARLRSRRGEAVSGFTGTGPLIRLILRRDRVGLPIWIVLVALAPIGIAASFAQLYPDAAALQAFADAKHEHPGERRHARPGVQPNTGRAGGVALGLASAILIAPVSMLCW